MLTKPVERLGKFSGGKLGKVGAPSMPIKDGKDGPGHAGLAAQLLHEQQLRILSSLYGAPLRCFGVPPTSAPAEPGNVFAWKGAGGGRAAGSGIAVVKEARKAARMEEAENIS